MKRWIRLDNRKPGEPRPNVTIEVRDRYGVFVPILFKIDSGADVSAMPVTIAKDHGIGFARAREGGAGGLVGRVKKYRDVLHLRIAGVLYSVPCDFTETPAGVSDREVRERLVPVLGRAGFSEHFEVTLGPDYVILTRLGPLRRWWWRLLGRLLTRFGLLRGPDDPL